MLSRNDSVDIQIGVGVDSNKLGNDQNITFCTNDNDNDNDHDHDDNDEDKMKKR